MDGRLVLVVGSRRSGTNWLQRILQTHTALVGPNGESFLFSQGVAPLMARFHHGSPKASEVGSLYADRPTLVAAMRAFCDTVLGDLLDALGPAERLVERTPEHVQCLDLVGELYPGVHVIHIIRNGRDVVRSLLSMQWGPAEAEVAAEEWRAAVVDGREAGRRLANYREVRYEELLADPEPIVRDLYEWLGVSADEEAVAAAVAEASRAFTVDPKQPTIGAGKWREGLDPAALAVLQRVAGDALADLGYGDATAGGPPVAVAAPPPAPGSRLTRLRRRLAGDITNDAAEALAIREQIRGASHVMNQVLSRLSKGLGVDVPVVADVRVEVVGGPDPFEGRGLDAWQRFRAHVDADPVWRGAQGRSDVFAAAPMTTAVVHFEGSAAHVLAMAIDRRRVIRRAAYHHLP